MDYLLEISIIEIAGVWLRDAINQKSSEIVGLDGWVEESITNDKFHLILAAEFNVAGDVNYKRNQDLRLTIFLTASDVFRFLFLSDKGCFLIIVLIVENDKSLVGSETFGGLVIYDFEFDSNFTVASDGSVLGDS